MTTRLAVGAAVLLTLGGLGGCAGPLAGGASPQVSCEERSARLAAGLATCREERNAAAVAQAASEKGCRQTRAMFDVCLAEDARKEIVVRELRGQVARAAAQRDECLREGPAGVAGVAARSAEAARAPADPADEAAASQTNVASAPEANAGEERGGRLVPLSRLEQALRECLAPWVGRGEATVETSRGRAVVRVEAAWVFLPESAQVQPAAQELLAAVGREGASSPGSLSLVVRVRRRELPKGPFVSLWEFAGARAASLAHEVQYGSRLAAGKLLSTGRVEDERTGPDLVEAVFLPEGEEL